MIMLHVAQCNHNGHQRILIRTVKTDVVVLAIAAVQHLNISELWVAFGARKHSRYIPDHTIAHRLVQENVNPCQYSMQLLDVIRFHNFPDVAKYLQWMRGCHVPLSRKLSSTWMVCQ